ncbi:MAG: hypothetical protein NZ553_01990 [Caldilinea sp.]|nr:hypothetical protein [Caldilinea sp.]MDW8439222.1 hypothetical protein [Caldilineaceae bacterium]
MQGSGKTYTMLTIARLLLEDPHFQTPPPSCLSWTATSWSSSSFRT